MIMDELLEFADASDDIQASTGTVLIGDVIDLGAEPQDFGNGQPMYLVIQVATEIDSSGDGASVQFTLASDAAAAIDTSGDASEHLITDTIAEATLTAGFRLVYPVPLGSGIPYERYLGLLATISGEEVTGGAIDAFLTFDPSYWRSYPDGDN